MLESQTSGLRTPQNLISPLPSPAPQNVSAEINTATRGVHARLNKLIVARLPFALPPQNDSPDLFALGLDRFAQIYFAFETRWHILIAQQKKRGQASSAHGEKVQEWLADLVPPGLWRTKAIRSDLDHLSQAFGMQLDGANAFDPQDSALLRHIEKVTTEKPHVLVAYAWIMYMAIFSGGRWIRQQLLETGPSFWQTTVAFNAEKSEFRNFRNPVLGFSLFYFDGERDGEDIKADFKARLELAEELLSGKERSDIANEAEFIFSACIKLVEQLDEELGTPSVPASKSDLVYAKAQGGHGAIGASPTMNRAYSPRTALSAVLLTFLAWFAWSWLN